MANILLSSLYSNSFRINYGGRKMRFRFEIHPKALIIIMIIAIKLLF